jgi:hypothetical protein
MLLTHTYFISSLVLCTKDADALRCVLLIAGLHFGNKAIGLGQFEPTYLHHKVQCIQTVNGLLDASLHSQDSSLVRMIATLCMVEVRRNIEFIFFPPCSRDEQLC